MNILLVYPRHPGTHWSFKHALKFVGKKAPQPPLGLLTIAAMLPESWSQRLVDTNVRPLKDADLKWADMVFVSAMSIQRGSVIEILDRCRSVGVKTVVGGPLFTSEPDAFPQADHLILNEAEVTLPPFLEDLEAGSPKRVYASKEPADMSTTPTPLWRLLPMRRYAAMSLQYSRGCPYDCDFCSIASLFGRKVRTKGRQQVVAELESLHQHGWRGDVFFVDDNFIGNQGKLKRDILPAILDWMNAHGHPFNFVTEVSVNLADNDELMDKMVRAGFDSVFVGIETPNDQALAECGKSPNTDRDLLESVKKMQRAGFQVSGGFILGFDSDSVSIFDRLSTFIQQSGIVNAMVGLLNAQVNTRLHERLATQGRLVTDTTGDNTDSSINFLPTMGRDALVRGYRQVIDEIYAPRPYYERLRRFLREFRPVKRTPFRLSYSQARAFVRSIFVLGVLGRERFHYWRLFFWTLFRRPSLLPLAITLAIYGFHFRKSYQEAFGRLLAPREVM